MSGNATLTINRQREEVERLWIESEYRPEYAADDNGSVTFRPAPGDRGTEIHVQLEDGGPATKLKEGVLKLAGSDPYAKVMDDLRRFKQHVETGVIARSDASPEGELSQRKLKQRSAQPLEDSEVEKMNV